VIGNTGFEHGHVDALAREAGVACFHAPNFAIGAALMMRFAEEAARHLPRTIVERRLRRSSTPGPDGGSARCSKSPAAVVR